ncbi:MAG: non-heme iron oxygenase ferredoxin subunit [Gammaproteobacteria bacterium]|nr:non-heme iron oxygenase ferredoxin subunit [Gammaproteobacteria bacterium]
MSDWVAVARVTDFPAGERRVVDVEGAIIAVFNLQGKYYAIEDVCTHDGGELASGELVGDDVICPRHGARFCIKTGEVKAPPATQPVDIFPVQVLNGVVQVKDDRWDQ